MKAILVDAVHTFVIGDEGMDQKMYDLLESYPNKKIVMTNANAEQVKKYAIDELPYGYFTMNHEPDKPDPLFYTTFLEKYGYSSEEVIYFEHNADAVSTARSIGIETFHFEREKRDLEGLKVFLDSNI